MRVRARPSVSLTLFPLQSLGGAHLDLLSLPVLTQSAVARRGTVAPPPPYVGIPSLFTTKQNRDAPPARRTPRPAGTPARPTPQPPSSPRLRVAPPAAVGSEGSAPPPCCPSGRSSYEDEGVGTRLLLASAWLSAPLVLPSTSFLATGLHSFQFVSETGLPERSTNPKSSFGVPAGVCVALFVDLA